jgi:hypothetical protein
MKAGQKHHTVNDVERVMQVVAMVVSELAYNMILFRVPFPDLAVCMEAVGCMRVTGI